MNMHTKTFPSIASRALFCLAGLGAMGAFTACGGGDDGSADAGAGSFITIETITPDHGPLAGGNVVTITGSGFTREGVDRNQVLVGDALASAVSVINDTTLEITAPAGVEPGPTSVTVFNGNGTAALGDIYSYNPLPTISSLAPSEGTPLGGETVTISGTGFQDLEPGENQVFFGDVQGTEVTVVNDGELTVVTPPGSLFGLTDVEVRNDNGSSNPESFQYVGSSLLVFGHARRGALAAPVAAVPGEVYQVDPISKTIEPTGDRLTDFDSDGVPICRGTMFDGSNLFARSHDGAFLRFGIEDRSVEFIGPIEGCARIHGVASHQGQVFAYCRNNQDGQGFGRLDLAAKTFTPIGNNTGGSRISLISDGTTLYLKKDNEISTINPNTGVRGPIVAIQGDGFAMRGMAFSDGVLYAVSTSFNGGPSEQTFLQSIDPTTGETDFIMTLGSGLRGLASSR